MHNREERIVANRLPCKEKGYRGMKIGGRIAPFLKAVYMDASIEMKVGEVHSKPFRVAYMWSTPRLHSLTTVVLVLHYSMVLKLK